MFMIYVPIIPKNPCSDNGQKLLLHANDYRERFLSTKRTRTILMKKVK